MRNLQGIFGGMQYVPGLGYVQGQGGVARTGLGDESAVMMISGLGNECVKRPDGSMDCGEPYGPMPGKTVTRVVPSSPGALKPASADLTAQLTAPLTLFNVTLPVWVWLVLAAALGGAGGYYLGGRR